MKRTWCVVFVNLMLPLVVRGADKAKLPAPQPSWNLRYESGSLQVKKEQWLKGAFVSGAGEQKDTAVVGISRDQLRSIYFDARAEKDSYLMQEMPRSGCAYARTRMPKDDSLPPPQMFITWLASPGPFSRAVEHLNARYPVRFVWADGGIEKELLLTVNDCEYASFIATLRRFAGQRWQEVGREFSH
jgi:hypothetical protein